MSAALNPYHAVLRNQFELIKQDNDPDKEERAWKIVTCQASRQDIQAAAACYYNLFSAKPKTVSLDFADGRVEFGASEIECFKRESPTLDKILTDRRVALTRVEFSEAINSSKATLEIAYYLNIPRLIEKIESDILKKIEQWKLTGNYQEALEFFKHIDHSQLKNCSFYSRLIENELADLFGSVILLYVTRPNSFKEILEAYSRYGIRAISLSFETDVARAAIKSVGSIDSLRTFKVNSFCVKDNEIVFPRHAAKVELINTTEITVETLKTLPVTVMELKLVGLHLSKDDLKHIPSHLVRLTVKEPFTGLEPVLLPITLKYLEFVKCWDFNEKWFKKVPDLETLIIRNCQYITGKILSDAPATLRHVEFIGSEICDEHIEELPDELQTLIVPGSNLTDSVNLPMGLQKLDVSGSKITDEALKKLPANLIFLNASRTSIVGSGFETLPDLTELILEGCHIKREYIPKIPRSVICLVIPSADIKDEDISHLPIYVRSVVLNGENLTVGGLLLLSRTVAKVKVVCAKRLTDDSIRYLPNGCELIRT